MLQTEQVLGECYQLQQQLGDNAGRQTWLAKDIKVSPAKPVILKLLAFSPQMQWDEFKLFEREAQVLKHLDHPRIPKYQDYFSLDPDMGKGLCWFALVQDYIPGQSLQQLLDDGQHFTEEQVRSLATQVLSILIYLHGLNPPVLHRDIKPSNLIWGEDEQVYLVDFGAVQDPTAVEGSTFTVVGTAGYAPLEQFYGKAVEASDLYALGATLIHLLTGTAPADLPQSNLRIQFQGQVSLKPSFLSWIQCLTEPDLERRFTSAAQALEVLQTGHSIRFSRQIIRHPDSRRIQLKKSRNQLVIKINTDRLSVNKIIKAFIRAEIFLFCLIFVFLPIILGVIATFVILFGIILGNLSSVALLLIIPLLLFFDWSGNKARKGISRVYQDFNQACFNCLGIKALYFSRNKNSVFIRLKTPGSWSANWYSLSKFKSLESRPYQGIVIHCELLQYIVGQELTEAEREWLVEEIQDWLLENEA